MSSRRAHRAQQARPSQPEPQGPPSREEMVQVNQKHLRYLETWSRGLETKVAGVDLMPCLTYELIQVLNQSYLARRLGQLPQK